MRLKTFFLVLLCLVTAVTASYGQKSKKKTIVSGHVTDINSRPVPGITIMVDNKNTNRITDDSGFYKIKIKPDAEIISIRLPSGQITKELIIGRTEINLSLPIDILSYTGIQKDPGDEEINVGYGTVKRKDLTQQVGKIDGTNTKYASYTSIYEMISGEVPGVQVQGKSITIRGINSINLSSAPLIVVDGMAVSSIDDIQPQMVRSIEVLKGSAASIYGSRGANGVILITLFGAKDLK
ncbi:MAG: TonB-dependent receptor plug domain-containing protein [Bacteroidales bacterium]|nr:TonB-dependent receptor plug domain-containing protein [Bacteroidales bacterium]